jgi:hypothetical protein
MQIAFILSFPDSITTDLNLKVRNLISKEGTKKGSKRINQFKIIGIRNILTLNLTIPKKCLIEINISSSENDLHDFQEYASEPQSHFLQKKSFLFTVI